MDVDGGEVSALRAHHVETMGREATTELVAPVLKAGADRVIMRRLLGEGACDGRLNGAPFTYVRNCFTVRTALVSSAGAATQPIFQPVTLNDLPALPTMIVRSRMPGRVAIGTCRRPSKTRCSYTSSAMTTRSFRSATSAITESSSDVNTLPVGLCGVLSRIALVLLVIAALARQGRSAIPRRLRFPRDAA